MADSILRLRVQSEEYDNKLKRASEAIQRYADGCRKAGGTLTQLDDGVLEFTKALGQMETVSNSARGKIGEMTKSFTELSVQYNKLTEEEIAELDKFNSSTSIVAEASELRRRLITNLLLIFRA
jgi:hypothetical protein